MKTKIQIKSILGKVLFEYENENATVKDAVEQAVREHVNLSEAKLYKADLRGANLNGAILIKADLRESILDKVDLSGANLCEANLCEASLRRANLNGASLREANLYRAYLRGADLGEAYLRGADLGGANLYEAYLRRANLNGASLREANLYGANLYGANICEANIREANLYGANLYGADLYGADLRGADLRRADLRRADLREAKNIPYIPLACPSDGAFIGWKKVHNHLVKLEIPENAKRSSATTNKCRCDKAKVLAITDLDGSNPIDEIENTSQEHHVTYKVGEMVYPNSFDEDRWNECSHGIHFFINKQEAVNY
jgi:uncharacterized protein YjbI with pentapeptide repeats